MTATQDWDRLFDGPPIIVRATQPAPSETVKAVPHKRRDIQGLRMVAVASVVVNHLTGHPQGGFVGVDVFFVISGFLITSLLLREHDSTGSISFRGFYARRIRRILPAAVLVIFATLIAAHHLTPGARFKSLYTDSWWSLLFSANWHFGFQGTNYFAQGLTPSPLQHYWSLAVEEQFYFVWPWLMLTVLALGAWRFGWTRGHRRVAAGVVITLGSAASFIYAMQESSNNPAFAYFNSFSRAWELGVGALVAICASSLSIKNVAVRTLLGWTGLAGILWSLFIVNSAHDFPAPGAALPVAFAALVIVAGLGGPQPFLWPLTNPLAQYLGDTSYSIYLWHFPVIILTLSLITGSTPGYYATCVVVTLALALASFHLIENPIRNSGWLDTTGTSPSLVLLPFLAVALVTISIPAFFFPRPPSIASAAGTTPGYTGAGAIKQKHYCLGAADIDPKGCDAHLGKSVTPTPSDAPNDIAHVTSTCFVPFNAVMQVCNYGSSAPDATKIAIAGDSHAATLMPALTAEAVRRNWNISTYFGAGCVWGNSHECDKAMPAIERALKAGHFAAVIVDDYRNSTVGIAHAAQNFRNAWATVEATGTTIIDVVDNPLYSSSALQCTQKIGFNATSNCATSLADAFKLPDENEIAAQQDSQAKIVDMTRYFCNASDCPAVIGGVLVYRDALAHITGTYSTTLAPYLDAKIANALKG